MRRVLARSAATLTAAVLIGLGFGMPASDRARIDAFAHGVRRWQVNPDFRNVQAEYVRLGSGAMQARWWGMPVGRVIMAVRSIPGVSSTYAVSPSSASHYADFTQGPLSAYLHLTGEQGLEMGLEMIGQLGRKAELSNDDLRAFLRSFNMPTPVATDRGAVESIQLLLSQTDASKTFVNRAPIAPQLGAHISNIARSSGIPVDPAKMSFQQQAVLLAQLDDKIRSSDPELWRSKQVSDFLAGIWAQGYGQIYGQGVTWFYRLRWGARGALGIEIALIAALAFRHRARKKHRLAAK